MKQNLMAWLLQSGLDEQRAELYLAALSKGEASARELAESLKLGRTAVYDNLRVLIERGFVTVINRGKRKIFIPIHPKELYKKIDSHKQQLKDLLPDFLSLYAATDRQPFVQLFDGPFAAREVYEDILKTTKKEYVYFSPPELTLQTVDRTFIEDWIGRRVTKGISCRALRVKPKTQQLDPIFTDETKYLRQIRYLPDYCLLHASVYIYENNIAVISTVHENVAFIIHSPDLSFTFQQLFEFLWGISVRT